MIMLILSKFNFRNNTSLILDCHYYYRWNNLWYFTDYYLKKKKIN